MQPIVPNNQMQTFFDLVRALNQTGSITQEQRNLLVKEYREACKAKDSRELQEYIYTLWDSETTRKDILVKMLKIAQQI